MLEYTDIITADRRIREACNKASRFLRPALEECYNRYSDRLHEEIEDSFSRNKDIDMEICYGNHVINLRGWEREGGQPDVVIINAEGGSLRNVAKVIADAMPTYEEMKVLCDKEHEEWMHTEKSGYADYYFYGV